MKLVKYIIALFFTTIITGCSPADFGYKIAEVVIEKRLGANSVSELEDGLHVVLCGAGSPLPDPVRSGPCVLIIAGDTLVTVDAGSGSTTNLLDMQVPLGEISAQLLTHFHSDHIDNLGKLGMMRWVNAANTSPLPVIGPVGTQTVVEGFNLAYATDAQYRHDHHTDFVAPKSGAGLIAKEFTSPEQGVMLTVFKKNGLIVKAFSVDHKPVHPAVGYHFEYKGRTVVISGDTTKSKNVEMAAKNVDLLVHEALSNELIKLIQATAENKHMPILAKVMFDIPDYHTSPVEAAQVAAAANARHLMYYHIVPALPAPGMQALFLKGTDDAYQGPITLGKDGSVISLPANSDEILEDDWL
jgi:ribonuclease Z